MAKKHVFEGRIAYEAQDGGRALIAQLDATTSDSLFVRLQSWEDGNPPFPHEDARALEGTRVRVTLTVLEPTRRVRKSRR